MNNNIFWHWSNYQNLSKEDLYEILKLRQEVFVLEQHCIYLDADSKDQKAWHLMAWDSERKDNLLAYLRVVNPEIKYKEPSIGRVLTSQRSRGAGLGKELVSKGIEFTKKEYPNLGIRISAQEYLEKFYIDLGFNTVSDVYIEENIAHVQMLLE